jgi:hypothetical protein
MRQNFNLIQTDVRRIAKVNDINVNEKGGGRLTDLTVKVKIVIVVVVCGRLGFEAFDFTSVPFVFEETRHQQANFEIAQFFKRQIVFLVRYSVRIIISHALRKLTQSLVDAILIGDLNPKDAGISHGRDNHVNGLVRVQVSIQGDDPWHIDYTLRLFIFDHLIIIEVIIVII